MTRAIECFGRWVLFVREFLGTLHAFKKRAGVFVHQCAIIGVGSWMVTAAGAIFLGAVLGYQLYISLHRFGAEALLGGTVGMTLFRELGPVMAALMVTGRAGASMAAELASMCVSEQVDALKVMGVDVVELLVMPRVLAGVCMLPLLAILFCILATISAFLIATYVMGLQGAVFWSHFFHIVDPIELTHCIVKASVFGLGITLIGCFCGLSAYGGAKAVGNAARNTVVASSLMILGVDYIVTSFLPLGLKSLRVM